MQLIRNVKSLPRVPSRVKSVVSLGNVEFLMADGSSLVTISGRLITEFSILALPPSDSCQEKATSGVNMDYALVTVLVLMASIAADCIFTL